MHQVMAWTEEIASDNSDIITIENIGSSYEGREIRLLRLSKQSDLPKIGVYLESREYDCILPPVWRGGPARYLPHGRARV